MHDQLTIPAQSRSRQAAARFGDLCTGHGCWPPRPNDQASSNVIINNLGAHRETDHWAVHCCANCHDGLLEKGSSSVIINGLPAARVGDPVTCGSYVMTGSPNVIIGG